MDKEAVKRRLREELRFLRDEVLGVLVYGSLVKGEATERSDIDVCVVAPGAEAGELMGEIDSKVSSRYDIKLFELMPMFLKGEVIDNHEVVWSKNEPELYEYLYFYRKLWEEQKRRQSLSSEEAVSLFRG